MRANKSPVYDSGLDQQHSPKVTLNWTKYMSNTTGHLRDRDQRDIIVMVYVGCHDYISSSSSS